MSERLFEAFREDAVSIIERPAFEEIAQRGRQRRLRRHAVVGAVAASALVVTGLLALPGGAPRSEQPTGPMTPSVTPYPVMTNTTLEAGTYELHPSKDTSLPFARFTLPAGWNSWLGPNRFAGLDDMATDENGTNHELLVRDPEWVLGMLVLDVKWIAQPGCTMTDLTGDDTTGLVQALATIPRLTLTSDPESTVRFGHPAVHLQLREGGGRDECPQDTVMTTAEASFDYLGRGTTVDAWVIETDAGPLVVWSVWTEDTPQSEIDALLNIVDTLEVVDPSQ